MSTSDAITATVEWETAITRSALYELLALTLAYPTTAGHAALQSRIMPVLAEVVTGDAGVDHRVRRVLDAFSGPLDELRAGHAALFTHIEPTDCPPYESGYVSGDIFRQTDVMADVAGFYRAHGLQVGGTERERPDHVVTELEFMAFMARKEAYALAELGHDQVTECRRTAASFLRDHLGCWGPDLGRRIVLVAHHEPLRAAGELLTAWLELDMTALEVAPAERLREPAPRPEPDDDDTCAAAGCLADCHPVPVELRRDES